ncbi:hypothetical protein M9H77_04141 [Catharanthus roseus]|uniref:Uncharacterized protein n=1 Tax=Catharanthus roseus TaxID=4058 RepID=A0ACC0CD54_CATRO|nr:hypothetical protein M9H77_04141 [Catharanthus roseus]
MLYELEHSTNLYINLVGLEERVNELVHRIHWPVDGLASYAHWFETPDLLYIIANAFNLYVILIAQLGSTTVLPLYSYSDCPEGTLVIGLLTEERHFIQPTNLRSIINIVTVQLTSYHIQYNMRCNRSNDQQLHVAGEPVRILNPWMSAGKKPRHVIICAPRWRYSRDAGLCRRKQMRWMSWNALNPSKLSDNPIGYIGFHTIKVCNHPIVRRNPHISNLIRSIRSPPDLISSHRV